MPIDSVQVGEVFTVRVYKNYVGYGWANTYEIMAVNEPTNSVAAIESAAFSFVNLEQQIHLQGVVIDRVVVSTYVPDGQPYEPTSFTTIPISSIGLRSPGADVLPLEMSLFVRRNTTTGRDGRLLYRGCLTEADMSAAAFRPLIWQGAVNEFQNIFSSWFNSNFPSNLWAVVMARGRPTPTNVRTVVGFQVSQKMVIKKLNNRYFDRP
jgi:hypothetical protein